MYDIEVDEQRRVYIIDALLKRVCKVYGDYETAMKRAKRIMEALNG